ncbi:MAG: 16S rRNA (uracil(1498)-N(3))-methyltransferase [Firmicutes bacterium]|nr:16S rRNA (uracil(1498)-N(3))-methyltransferase [Bacillota bacterium]
MRKIFVDKAEKTLVLSQEEHKHLSVVLRAKIGDELIVSAGDGFDYRYEIQQITKNQTTLNQIGKSLNKSEPNICITLYTAILKGDKNETVTRTCTELGVVHIIPFVSQFCAASASSYKLERNQKIAVEAAKQSGRGRVPRIDTPVPFSEVVSNLSGFDVVVFAYERAESACIKSFLREQFTSKCPIKTVAVIVGSEGGFSEKEAELLYTAGVEPLTLGKRILRADTACAAVCAAVLYEAGEMA